MQVASAQLKPIAEPNCVTATCSTADRGRAIDGRREGAASGRDIPARRDALYALKAKLPKQ
jgi:hypothetical protein